MVSVPICRFDNITLGSSIVLKDLFYVPQLTNSLISIQKLTKDLNILVTSFLFLLHIPRPCHEEDNFNCQGTK